MLHYRRFLRIIGGLNVVGSNVFALNYETCLTEILTFVARREESELILKFWVEMTQAKSGILSRSSASELAYCIAPKRGPGDFGRHHHLGRSIGCSVSVRASKVASKSHKNACRIHLVVDNTGVSPNVRSDIVPSRVGSLVGSKVEFHQTCRHNIVDGREAFLIEHS